MTVTCTKQTVELWLDERGYPAKSLPPNVQRWINRLVNEAYGRGVEAGKRQAAVIFGKVSDPRVNSVAPVSAHSVGD